MKLRDIIAVLEAWAPPAYQEGYDNSGLIVGSPEEDVHSALLSLDCTEAVVDEAIRKNMKTCTHLGKTRSMEATMCNAPS